jgi:hypothetical protein
MNSPFLKLIALGLIASLIGCGQPAYYKCNGVATHEGKPMAKLQISFVNEDPNAGRPSISMSDENGNFQMTTGANYGVPPGKYKVVIEDPTAADGRKTSTEPDYVYVVKEYSPAKSTLTYESNSHQGNYQLKLDKLK